jgi:hypothetical protein
MPPKLANKTEHIPLFGGRRRVPPSLREAILAFILATTVRKIRGTHPVHNSMLVHVVRYTKVQKLVGQQVESEVRGILQRLQNGDGDRSPGILDEFHSLWDSDFLPTNAACTAILGDVASPSPPVWSEVAKRLREVTAAITIKLTNGSAKDALDYEEHKATGINVIAIGGDKLSRGLTLEGLTVSYFLRASRMYDTLMQMGRWFGYRDGYSDVCRLYTSCELMEWFAHISDAGEELQREFEQMVNVGGTPRDYGLKVRSHSLLLVTSPLKMRNGTELKLTFSGDISETIIFDRNPGWIMRNFIATEDWLVSLGPPSPGARKGRYTWPNVDARQVLQFLASYSSHEGARRADTVLLSRYISKQRDIGELISWTVLLVSSSNYDAQPSKIAGHEVGLIRRAAFPEAQGSQRYTIRRLVSPVDELVDLSPQQQMDALELTVKAWNDAEEPKRKERPERPGGREIRATRPKTNGLLLLYPLDLAKAGITDFDKPLIGMAVSFPKSDTAQEISYIVDNVFVRTGGDDENL